MEEIYVVFDRLRLGNCPRFSNDRREDHFYLLPTNNDTIIRIVSAMFVFHEFDRNETQHLKTKTG